MKNLTELDAQEELRSGLEELVAAMVEHREAVSVAHGAGTADWPVLVAVCHRADVGTVLGKKGDTLDKLRLLATLTARRLGFNGVSLDFDEPSCQGEPHSGPRPPLVPNPNWDAEWYEKLATTVVANCLGRCAVALEPGPTRYKLSIALLEALPVDEALTRTKDGQSVKPVKAVEAALRKALGCAGAVAGQLVSVEVSDESN